MSSKKSVIVIAVTTVALTLGSVGVGQAASKSKFVSSKSTRVSTVGVANPIAKAAKSEAAIASILTALVAQGTITQAQADAIKAAFAVAVPVRGKEVLGKVSRHLKEQHAATETLISKTIGVETATIRARLAAGESLGLIAGAKKAELISVLVADHTKRIDAAVTAGKITAAQATTMKAGLTAHVTAAVDRVGGKRGPGMGGKEGKRGQVHGGTGHGGKGMGGMGAAPTTPAPAVTPSA
jgi:hypothetical protein